MDTEEKRAIIVCGTYIIVMLILTLKPLFS